MRNVAACLVLAALLACLGVAIPSSGTAAAAPAVEYRTSRMLGLVLFATSISGAPNRPPALRETFSKSPYNNPETHVLIAEFRELHDGLREGVDFAGGPSDRPNGATLEQILLLRALDAGDLAELQRTTQALMPLSRQNRYFEILAAFERIYDPLVWEPCREKLERYRSALEEKSRTWGIDAMFEAASRFYGADWPRNLPFTIALHPIPGREGGTSAESIGSLETVAVLVDETDHARRFGVIFHEMCHSLYEAQPLAFQAEMSGWFESEGSAHAPLAASMINEGLATAIGNGWAAAAARGKLDEGPWYNDGMIDAYAKALHPMVAAYIEAGKTIDRDFVLQGVASYREAFPEAPYRLDLLLREIVLMTDGETVTSPAARDAFLARFRISSIYECAPIDDPQSLQVADDHPATLIVMLGTGQTGQLAALSPRLPSLAASLDELQRNPEEGILAGREGPRVVIVVKVGAADRIAGAVDALRDIGTLDGDAAKWVRLP